MLVVVTLFLYWPAIHCDFINYDDPDYVTLNPRVQTGLLLQNIGWAFTACVSGNWHPLTLLSLILDVKLFGSGAAGFHFTNLVLHAVNALLLFGLLWRLTGARWRSFGVAALFAWHPLHVESVAWVAERKDVLSTGFGFLALRFYVGYAMGVAAQAPNSRGRAGGFYWTSLLAFALGLLSKPMLVTWPFVLLLLDYWPLQRFQPGRGWPLVREKIPFLALAAAASVVTFLVQQQRGLIVAFDREPLDMRGGNALIAYVRYVGKVFWPSHLAVFYPHPGYWPPLLVLLSGGFLVGLSVMLWVERRRYPFLLVGWLWFIGTLVPVIGLVQVGPQSMADRYTYIPSVGLLIMIVWGAEVLTRHWPFRRIWGAPAVCATFLGCLALTRHQLGYWQNSETLFRHALAVTKNNCLAHNYLGAELYAQGQTSAAIEQFHDALRLQPDYAGAHFNLALALLARGQTNDAFSQFQEAIALPPDVAILRPQPATGAVNPRQIEAAMAQFQAALQHQPDYANAHNSLGVALAAEGRLDAAISQFQAALRLAPDYPEAHYNLGLAFLRQGQTDSATIQFQTVLHLKPDDHSAHYSLGLALVHEGQMDAAIGQFQAALAIKPQDAQCHYDLGTVLLKQCRWQAAIDQFQATLQQRPDDADAHYNLGLALARDHQTAQAITEFQAALRSRPDFVNAHNNLGAALAGVGRFDEAVSQFQAAIRLQPNDASAQNNLAKVLALKSATTVTGPKPGPP